MTLTGFGRILLRGFAILTIGLGAGLSLAMANLPPSEWLATAFGGVAQFIDLLRPHWAWIAVVGLIFSFFSQSVARRIGYGLILVGAFLTFYALVSFANGANTV